MFMTELVTDFMLGELAEGDPAVLFMHFDSLLFRWRCIARKSLF